MSGMVYLVGAGPGDPGLLTRRGAACLAKAQVVVYDFLANPQLLALAPESAQHIYVGKKGGDHTMGQEGINQLLCDLAGDGKTVVRLKGGDPYVFGRGGEEASALAACGHAFEVVPGITSAIAAPSYAGIPVTDRRHATEVAFITGHEDPSKPGSTINWTALAGISSLVFLMGVKNLPHICASLIKAGKPADTPAACVRWGSTPRQRTVTGTLGDLPQKVKDAGLRPPAITVVGPVVALREELCWFERLPLFGKKVLVTRTRQQASKLSSALSELGAQVVEIPTIELAPPDDYSQLMAAAQNPGSYELILFTSANGVEAFFAAMDQAGKDARALAGATVGAIGPATSQALKDRGIKADVEARSFVAEGLLEALQDFDLAGKRVLIPRAKEARELLPETLRAQGALVEVAPAYRTIAPQGAGDALAQALADGMDVITFTASSTVTNLMALLSDADAQRLRKDSAAGRILISAIGPITKGAATHAGLTVHLTPDAYTIAALVESLAAHFQTP